MSPDSTKMTFCSLCQCHYHLFPAKKKAYKRDLAQNNLEKKSCSKIAFLFVMIPPDKAAQCCGHENKFLSLKGSR